MSKVIVSQGDAAEICEALGYHTARKWNRKEMARRLKEISAEVEDDPDMRMDGELGPVLDAIVAVKGEVELTGKGETQIPDGESQPLTEDSKVDPPVAEDTIDEVPPDEEDKPKDETPEPERPKGKRGRPKGSKNKSKGDTKSKAEKDAKPKADRANVGPVLDGTPTGIHSLRNRLFCAGVVIKKHGLEPGITEELVDEVDKLCGKPNKVASKSQLSFVWHGINGYLNGE